MNRIREIGAELIRVLKYDLDALCQKVLDAYPDPDTHACAPEPEPQFVLRPTKTSYLRVVDPKRS